MAKSETFWVTQTTKSKLPHLSFNDMKTCILGSSYTLSLVFIGDKRSQSLNKRYRGKDKRANVLSFPLEKNDGEIFINLKEAERDAPLYKESTKQFVAHLFIHGMLHLKGYSHGSRMEIQERKFRKKFAT